MGTPIVNGLGDAFQKLWPFRAVKAGEEIGGKIQDTVEPLLQRMGLMPTPDTSWHDQQVQNANKSFQMQPMLHPEQPPAKAVRK